MDLVFAETDDGWSIDWVYWEKSSTVLKFFGDPNDWIELGLTNFDLLMDQTAVKVATNQESSKSQFN